MYRAIAAVCLAAGLFLAFNHPLVPAFCLFAVGTWAFVVSRWPSIWLLAVPALLPVMDFLPWTGWVVLEEFDLLLLATAAGSYWRLSDSATAPGRSQLPRRLILLLLLAWTLACVRGVLDAGGLVFDWYAGYRDSMNSLRIFKSLAGAALLMPALTDLFRRDGERAWRMLATGIAAGLAIASLVVTWERASFPGLLDFSTRYRSVGSFWEMHVGGAALDGYLALTVPFAAWALLEVRGRAAWVSGAFLALLSGYACLTTFSRGLYFAVVLGLMVLAWLRLRPEGPDRAPGALTAGTRSVLAVIFLTLAHAAFRWHGYRGAIVLIGAASAVMAVNAMRQKAWWPAGWRTHGGMLVAMLLLVEVIAVVNGGSFLLERLGEGQQDFRSRMAHWARGAATLGGYSDWMLGKGLGRLPKWYSQLNRRYEVPADMRHAFEDGNGFALLAGPPGNKFVAGSFGMGQRVSAIQGGATYTAAFDVRASAPTPLEVSLCDDYLIHEVSCVGAQILVQADNGWQQVETVMAGKPPAPIPWYSARQKVFSISILAAGKAVAIDNVSLTVDGRQWLQNGDFSQGLARWYLSGESYFVPWHVDNLILEVLIDQGVVGLIAFGLFAGGALWRVSGGVSHRNTAAPFVAATMVCYLAVGAFASLMDAPRVAFLFFLLSTVAWLLPKEPVRDSRPT